MSIHHLRSAIVSLVALVAGCASSHRAPFQQLDSETRPAGESRSPLAPHAVHGATIRDAVARGDLDAARNEADALIELATENGTSGPHTKIGAMIAAAKRVRASKTTREAAEAFAALSQRCGDCHAAFITGPRSIPRAVPQDFPDPSGMRRHQWAAARLWEGLVAPSDEAWRSGALTLAEAPLEPTKLTPGMSPHPRVSTLAAEMHSLGRDAASVAAPEARVMVYAQIMMTCATCHQWLGGGPSGP